MIIKTINENPLTVTVDDVQATILTYNYNEGETPRECKYIVVGEAPDKQNVVIQSRWNFDASGSLPDPNA